VKLRIETKNGVLVRALTPVSLQAGARSLVWDGNLPHGTKAYGGVYVAHVFVTSDVGTSDIAVPFAFRRT
jgi:flagellar hook assembly protein FlgD